MKRIQTICLILLLLIACVPTPENPIVIGKDNEAMIEKAKGTETPSQNSTGLREQLGCPEVFSPALTDEAKHIVITGDAPVSVPETEGLPLLYVEAGRFSQETVYAFFNRLCGDVTMYEFPTETPKYAIQAQIDESMERIEELRRSGVSDDDFELSWRLTDLEKLKKLFIDAPDEVTLIPSDGTLHEEELSFSGKVRGTCLALNVLSDPFSKSGGKRFSVLNDADYSDDGVYTVQDEQGNLQGFFPKSGSRLFYARTGGDLIGSYTSGTKLLDVTKESESGEPVAMPDVTIMGWDAPETLLLSATPKEARTIAETLLTDCGVTDMRLDSIALYTNRREIRSEWEDVEEARAACSPERQVYAVRFLREVKGVPIEGYYGSSISRIDDVEYGREWSYEILEIAVDDEGIASLEWCGPLVPAEVETERAKLLPFSEIRAIFLKMLPIKYFNINSETTFSIRLDRVRLCLWRILDRDSYTRGILAPVWCFYGSVNGIDAQMPLLIVNAVDGTVIDPQNGY